MKTWDGYSFILSEKKEEKKQKHSIYPIPTLYARRISVNLALVSVIPPPPTTPISHLVFKLLEK